MIIELIEPSKIRQSHLNLRRRNDDAALAQLEASLESIGQIQPIICRVTGYRKENQVDEIIECISGARRLLIAQKQQLPRIKAIIYDFQELSDTDAIELFIADNPHLSQEEKNKILLRLLNFLEIEQQKKLSQNPNTPELSRIERIARTYQIKLMQPTT
jgi:ParB-like chromosome segregation protein Spo0J